MDLGILFGVLGTWIIIAWALMASGDMGYYYDLPSVILVCGGTFTVAIFAIPLRQLKQTFAVLRRAFLFRLDPIESLIKDMVRYAEIARRDGILSLENVTKDIRDEFIVRGIQMAVDGTDPELIEQVMTNDLDNVVDRHGAGKAIFDTMAKYAPAYGMIGTLVGLVIMLQNMDDPSKIGPGMAVALITTLYGALIANAFCLPLSDRLAQRSAEEVLRKTIIIKAVMSIQSGDSPRVVEQRLRTFLPPRSRSTQEPGEKAA